MGEPAREFDTPVSKLFKHPVRLLAVLRLLLYWIRTYFTAQLRADIEQAVVVETAADDRIPPAERSIYPYLFAGTYVGYVGWYLLEKLSRPDYKSAQAAYLAMIDEAREVFTSRPTRMRDRQRTRHPLTRYVQSIDGPTNCFPSLHVALMALSYQIVKDSPDADEGLLGAMRQSCIDICRSTLQTKQHSIIDVLAGIELSRRAYATRFQGSFIDLRSEILPELSPEELAAASRIVDEAQDLTDMLDALLEEARGWPGEGGP